MHGNVCAENWSFCQSDQQEDVETTCLGFDFFLNACRFTAQSKCTPFQATFLMMVVFLLEFHGTADWSFTLHLSPGHFSHDTSGGLSSRVPWHSWLVLVDVNSFDIALFSTLKQTHFTERVASLFSGMTRRAAWRV